MGGQDMIVRQELKPAYYERFRCLMGDCRLSCCKDSWKITFTKKDYLKLRGLKCSPALEKELKQGMRRIRGGPLAEKYYAEFDTSTGACPMQTEEGLCGLQLEQGGEVLPSVCRMFPRLEMKTPMALEKSLSPACEGVLALLWDLPEGVDFVLTDLPEAQWRKTDALSPLMGAFPEIRSLCIDFLQDRTLPLPQRVLLMGIALKTLSEQPDTPEQWLRYASALLADPQRGTLCAGLLRQGGAQLAMGLAENVNILLGIKTGNKEFLEIRKQIVASLGISLDKNRRGDLSLEPYAACRARFQGRFGEQGESFFENLMVTLFFSLALPRAISGQKLWKDYVNFCNLYNFYWFMAVMSCHDEAADLPASRAELFRYLTVTSRRLIHSQNIQATLTDEIFRHDCATLAHMAILLSG